jgi:hypothetical protein
MTRRHADQLHSEAGVFRPSDSPRYAGRVPRRDLPVCGYVRTAYSDFSGHRVDLARWLSCAIPARDLCQEYNLSCTALPAAGPPGMYHCCRRWTRPLGFTPSLAPAALCPGIGIDGSNVTPGAEAAACIFRLKFCTALIFRCHSRQNHCHTQHRPGTPPAATFTSRLTRNRWKSTAIGCKRSIMNRDPMYCSSYPRCPQRQHRGQETNRRET